MAKNCLLVIRQSEINPRQGKAHIKEPQATRSTLTVDLSLLIQWLVSISRGLKLNEYRAMKAVCFSGPLPRVASWVESLAFEKTDFGIDGTRWRWYTISGFVLSGPTTCMPKGGRRSSSSRFDGHNTNRTAHSLADYPAMKAVNTSHPPPRVASIACPPRKPQRAPEVGGIS